MVQLIILLRKTSLKSLFLLFVHFQLYIFSDQQNRSLLSINHHINMENGIDHDSAHKFNLINVKIENDEQIGESMNQSDHQILNTQCINFHLKQCFEFRCHRCPYVRSSTLIEINQHYLMVHRKKLMQTVCDFSINITL